ncbi:MAG: phosphotransferase [bacterium]
MKAVLLAAGLGMRMRPLTDNLPKAMLPLWGKPLVGHVIDLVRSWGVREILVNAHHSPAPLIQYLMRRPKDGIMINISFEPDLLGTGGALKHAAWFAGDAPFWIVNTDIAVDVSPLPLLAEFHKHPAIAALWLDAQAGPRTVEMHDHQVGCFSSARPGTTGTYTFCGLQLVSPALLRYMPDGRCFSLVEIYERALAAGEEIRGLTVPDSYWADLGTPPAYREAHREVFRRNRAGLPGGRLLNRSGIRTTASLRRSGITVSGYASVGAGASVGTGATIVESVVWDGAQVKPGCRLANSIAAGGAVVSGDVEGVAAPFRPGSGSSPLTVRALSAIGWKTARTTAISLGARGSDRSFTRLSAAGRNAIMIRYGTSRPENGRYASHALFLKAGGVPVPAVQADIPEDRTVIMEYVTGPSLEQLAESLSSSALEKRYRHVLDAVLLMHGIPQKLIKRRGMNLEPQFSAAVYSWERDLVARHFLRGWLNLEEPVVASVVRELESVADRLAAAPLVLVHRDLQSSNIIWSRNRPVLIDFQGMRLGPAVYDLASLLCDPYVQLRPAVQLRLLEYYAARTARPEQVKELFWWAAVQRLAQALGAFGRLGASRDTRGFARHIAPGLVMMDRALSHVEGLDRTRTLVRRLVSTSAARADGG